jgi:hypothetical protein
MFIIVDLDINQLYLPLIAGAVVELKGLGNGHS